MKKSDIAMIILIASLSIMAAYGAVSALPVLKLSDKGVSVPVAEQYTATVESPDTSVFNKDAINPTVGVTIGGEQSQPDSQE